MKSKIVKPLFISYVFLIVLIGLIIKYRYDFIDSEGLNEAFNKYISFFWLFPISFIVGVLIFEFGFKQNNIKLIKKIVGIISFGISIVFINSILSFLILISYNNVINSNSQEMLIEDFVVIESEQYKLSNRIKVTTQDGKQEFNLSTNHKYLVGEKIHLKLKKGKLGFYYQ